MEYGKRDFNEEEKKKEEEQLAGELRKCVEIIAKTEPITQDLAKLRAWVTQEVKPLNKEVADADKHLHENPSDPEAFKILHNKRVKFIEFLKEADLVPNTTKYDPAVIDALEAYFKHRNKQLELVFNLKPLKKNQRSFNFAEYLSRLSEAEVFVDNFLAEQQKTAKKLEERLNTLYRPQRRLDFSSSDTEDFIE